MALPEAAIALRRKRFAAAASRFAVSRNSIVWPVESTARYRYRSFPFTFRYVSSILYDLFTGLRCGRQRLLISGAYACTQRQMQLAFTSRPRSPNSSATCWYESGYRRYHLTASRITSPGYWRPLNGLVGVIGMDFLPYQSRTQPSQRNPTCRAA